MDLFHIRPHRPMHLRWFLRRAQPQNHLLCRSIAKRHLPSAGTDAKGFAVWPRGDETTRRNRVCCQSACRSYRRILSFANKANGRQPHGTRRRPHSHCRREMPSALTQCHRTRHLQQHSRYRLCQDRRIYAFQQSCHCRRDRKNKQNIPGLCSR